MVVQVNAKSIAENIYAQMQLHSSEISDEGYEIKVSKGFVALKSSAYTSDIDSVPMNYRYAPEDKINIRKYVFNGFKKCLYPSLKFDSDSERRLSVIIDRESI